MKQLKFLMVAFTLLMGVSFTSCLNDDAGESMYDGIGYVRTVMGSYFVDLYGNTYHPISSRDAIRTINLPIWFPPDCDVPGRSSCRRGVEQGFRCDAGLRTILTILILPDMQVPWKIWRLYQKLLLL